MFKIGLLASTAMTAVALVLSGAPDAALAQTAMRAADRDTNARFLCTYGQFDVSWYKFGQSGSYTATWTDVAVRVKGQGKLVSRILVQEEQGSGDGRFSAGIYSNTASGHPGSLIAGGSAIVSGSCAKVTIPIAPTTLQDKQTYWIVEQVLHRGHGTVKVGWAIDPTRNQKAYVQTHSSSSDFSYTSPWKKQSSGPWFRLK